MSVLFSVNYFTLLNVVRVKLTNWHVIGKYVWFLGTRTVRCVYTHVRCGGRCGLYLFDLIVVLCRNSTVQHTGITLTILLINVWAKPHNDGVEDGS